MTTFIKLSFVIINTNYIHRILIRPNKYNIFITNHNVNGFMFFGSGAITSIEDNIEIDAQKNTGDYIYISEWIKNKL